MIRIPIWTFWSLNVLGAITFIYLQKKNARLLSSEETKKKTRALSEKNSLKHWENWIFIAISVVFVILNNFFAMDLSINLYFYLMITSLTHTVFTNRKLFRQIDLPDEYIKKEFNLGIFVLLILAIDILFIF